MPGADRNRNHLRLSLLALAGLATEAGAFLARGYRRPGRAVVRCRDGHLFATVWIPGASVKALRLGPWRVQRCPVGRHWTIVSLVDPARLSDADRTAAKQARDLPLP